MICSEMLNSPDIIPCMMLTCINKFICFRKILTVFIEQYTGI